MMNEQEIQLIAEAKVVAMTLRNTHCERLNKVLNKFELEK